MRSRTPVWLWAVPLLTCGCLAPAGPLAIAAKKRTRSAWLWFGGFAAAWVVAFTVLGSQPEEAGGENLASSLATALYFLTAVGATAYSLIKAQEVDWGPAPITAGGSPYPSHQAYGPNAAAIASIQAARQKRVEAMEIVRRDPMMARELRIGRPDLPRHFDDGGLVDVNSAPGEAFVRGLGLSEAATNQVLAARERLGRFQHPDDLMNLAGLDLDTFQRIQDRIVLL